MTKSVTQHSEPISLNTVMPEVYQQLRATAQILLSKYHGSAAQNGHPTLQATALVHEAWARLIESGCQPEDRNHLTALAGKVIRNVLIDYARSRKCEKRGGGRSKVALDETLVAAETRNINLIELDEALDRLEQFGPRQARVIELRFFGGLTMREIAETLDLSLRTIEQDWVSARTWLHGQLDD